jgi:PleD family two-component response regulator
MCSGVIQVFDDGQPPAITDTGEVSNSRYSLATVSVLVVDDEPAVRELQRRWLVQWGYSVATVATAADALEA